MKNALILEKPTPATRSCLENSYTHTAHGRLTFKTKCSSIVVVKILAGCLVTFSADKGARCCMLLKGGYVSFN